MRKLEMLMLPARQVVSIDASGKGTAVDQGEDADGSGLAVKDMKLVIV